MNLVIGLLAITLAGCGAEMAGSSSPSSTAVAPSVQAQQAPPLVSLVTPPQATAAPLLDASKVVFMGDSITQNWGARLPSHLDHIIDVGIGGNTTPMMLARFDTDAMATDAKTVVILAGINDIRFLTDANTSDLLAMAIEAGNAGRTVILSELLPVSNWHPPVVISDSAAGDADIAAWNLQIHWMGIAYGWQVANYHDALQVNGAQDPTLFIDGLHPSAAGYAVMEPILAALLPAEAGWH